MTTVYRDSSSNTTVFDEANEKTKPKQIWRVRFIMKRRVHAKWRLLQMTKCWTHSWRRRSLHLSQILLIPSDCSNSTRRCWTWNATNVLNYSRATLIQKNTKKKTANFTAKLIIIRGLSEKFRARPTSSRRWLTIMAHLQSLTS